MDKIPLIHTFWSDVAAQNAAALEAYFLPNAYIRWHNTNEEFTVEEYIIANCEYPGNWQGEIERTLQIDDLVVSVTRVWSSDNSSSFHVTSFFEFSNEKVIALNEYWGDDGIAPGWRLEKHIGKPIK